VSRPLPKCRARELVLPVDSGKVIGLACVRRSGKTFLLFHKIQQLVEQGIGRPRLLYLNFEDDRLQPLRAEELDLILRCHRELYPETIGQRCYLFLDEVQNVPGWERWVRRLHDTEDVEVFVTGCPSRNGPCASRRTIPRSCTSLTRAWWRRSRGIRTGTWGASWRRPSSSTCVASSARSTSMPTAEKWTCATRKERLSGTSTGT